MASLKQLKAWEALREPAEERARQLERERIGAEFDAVLARGRIERDVADARDRLSRSMHPAVTARAARDVLRREAQAGPGKAPGRATVLTPEQRAERHAEIRRGVEADMRRWEGERAAPAPSRPASPTPAGSAATAPRTAEFGGNRYAVAGSQWRLLGPSPATRQVPAGTRVGEIRSVQGFRYQWTGSAWVDGAGNAMPMAAA